MSALKEVTHISALLLCKFNLREPYFSLLFNFKREVHSMVSVLNSVDSRTNLVGKNRLELLLFNLSSRQIFAINVFKVKEVIKVPALNKMPNSHSLIEGVANIRGESIPIINLKSAIGMTPLLVDHASNIIITEYNGSVQGFLVGAVEHIINMNWEEMMEPPNTIGRHHYLTAITKVYSKEKEVLVEIIDVEKVLASIVNYKVAISEGVLEEGMLNAFQGVKILHADDSITARKQVENTLSQLGVEVIAVKNGREALTLLQNWASEGKRVTDEILMLITDAEMPIMDGYKLTEEIRKDPRLVDLYVLLNTSLSGSFNTGMAEKVGCDALLPKFEPDRIVNVVQNFMKTKLSK